MMRVGINRKLIAAFESILKYPNSQISPRVGEIALFYYRRVFLLCILLYKGEKRDGELVCLRSVGS